ncbi:MAG: hypothetical protein FWC23_01860 [Chitinispirillia bacterium]|nr:hypothetical protein [Chitinispirillia bacterium]MCL2267923.1 hypothetical protein [Chitinispirillia bacterium]
MRNALIIFLAFCTFALAQERQTVAVYMAGEEPQSARGAHKVLGGELVKTINGSGRYIAVDRTEAIQTQLVKEHTFQQGGAVDDAQIKNWGKQFSVQYLCIVEISALKGGQFYLDVRLVDVETAVTSKSATADSDLRDAGEIMRVARYLARGIVDVGGVYDSGPGLRPLVPGWAQIHRGSNGLGTFFIVGEAALIGGAVMAEVFRQDNDSKVNSTFNSAQRQRYIDNTNAMQNLCIGLLIGAAGLYVWNVADGFAGKRQDGVQASRTEFKITPYADSRSGGLMLTLDF